MKQLHSFAIIIALVAFNLTASAQYNPCDVVDVAMRKVDAQMADGNFEKALDMLKKIKADPKIQDCEQMKVVDYKIKHVEEELAKQNQSKSYLTCPDGNHPHLIDLGLPSGTKWACCNVGASMPEAYGDYYAWGETQTKSTYDWSTYKYCNGTKESCQNIGNDIAGTQYDVAHVRWGGSWVMPSYAQQQELFDNCAFEWKTNNGVKGMMVKGKNGGTIFLPAAGYRFHDKLFRDGSKGYFWLSSMVPSGSKVYFLDASSDMIGVGYTDRLGGHPVRPVIR